MRRRRIPHCRAAAAAMAVLLLLAAGCQDITAPPATIPGRSIHAPSGPPNKLISPNIDLDQQDLILHYKNTNGNIVDVIPPWGSAAQVSIDILDNVRFDHATADGWVVVYNTFDPTLTNTRPVLILYNKYRGVLRWWWYNDQGASGPSNYLNYALMIDGNTTSAFNFSGEFATDYTVQSLHPFVTKSNNSAMNSGLLGFSWYYFDTEFAYDPQIANQPQSSYSLHLNSWATSTAQVALTGDVSGTINGTITGSGSGASLIGSTAISIANNSYTSAVVSTPDGTKATSLISKLNSALSSALTSALQSDLNALASGGLSMLTHPLGKVFNSLLSSKPSNQQRVALNLAAKINLNGNVTTTQPAMNFAGALPGTARGDQSGWLPYYNNTLGVFNLSSPPVVKYKVINYYPPPPPGYKDVQYLVQVPPSIVLNPAIASEVTISPPTVTLIYLKQYSGKDVPYNPNYVSSTAFSNWALINNLYGNEWYAFSAPYAVRYSYWSGSPDPNVVVQIAFTIYPNNGAPPVDVVKTYRPTFIPG